MSKKSLSPYGCQHCTKKYEGAGGFTRCRDTGHKTRFLINAKWHCKGFNLDRANSSRTAEACSSCKSPNKLDET